jgi:anti-sigma factor RsiW
VDPWTDRLSDYIDDELAAPERRELEAHLTACNECRSAVAELRAVVARASTVATLSPETDLWPGVERRIREVRPPRRVSLSLPQVAAAALLLMALSGGLVWMLRSPTVPPARQAGASTVTSERAPVTAVPVSFPDETYAQAVIDLQRALEQGRHRLDPGTVLVIEQNLAAIDAAIVQAQRALESDPSNTYLNTHLVQARQRKLALLRRVNAMADPEG